MTEILDTIVLGPNDHLIVRVGSLGLTRTEAEMIREQLVERIGERFTIIAGPDVEVVDVDLKTRLDRLEELMRRLEDRVDRFFQVNPDLWDGS